MPGQRISPELDRNIHFIDANNDEIGGTWQNGSLTWAEMSEWMQIVFQLPLDIYAPFPCLEDGDPQNPIDQHGPAINVLSNINCIQPRFYVLLDLQGKAIEIPINPENPLPRTLTRSLSQLDPRTEQFRDRVRARDARCVVTLKKPRNGAFTTLEAAHIFPVAHLDLWRSGSWKQQITDDEYLGQTGIHSIQNGILLRSDVHRWFDKYYLAINPDNDYKTYCFVDEPELDGKEMFRNLDSPLRHQPCRALLKYHFQMAVLLNMKARAGYPEWDEDIPDGYDLVAEIANSEQGKLRFETVLAGKLHGLTS